MNSDDDHKRIPPDPVEIEKMLEIELMQKRAQWQQSKSRRGALRVLSFFFLFLVILIGLLVFYWSVSSGRLNKNRSKQAEEAQPSTLSTP